MSSNLCPCQSAKPFRKCCQPFLSGQMKAKTVKQLMRSRYSAFVLGGQGEYLLHTWHPAGRGAVTANELDQVSVHWTHLQVLEASQQGDTGKVEFIAHFIAQDGSQGVHHEHSTFVREQGQWLYCEGEISPQP